MLFRDDIKVGSNVRLRLMDKVDGDVVEQRESHNIFTDFGREWISEIISYDAGLTPYRDDRVRFVSVGIGGTAQTHTSDNVRTTMGYAGFPNDWDYSTSDLSTGGIGGTGSGNPSQTDTDPAVTGLEYPVQMTDEDYYDEVKQPSSYPEPGIVRFTAVLGYNDVSFGTFSSVPISEVGLFTGSLTQGVLDQSHPPLDSTIFRDPQTGPPYFPPTGTRYMIAYNTFASLSKTNAFVLQVDWELRFQ